MGEEGVLYQFLFNHYIHTNEIFCAYDAVYCQQQVLRELVVFLGL